MEIIRLDNHTIEQIAAGEVIEAPVSIVKELVENSIDAKARNITVEIKNGGKTYIRVTDDGVGIDKDQMRLAFEKHATSKIANFEDLYDIYSLGFRGEALASIVTVADVSAISKTAEADFGSKITFIGPKQNQIPVATNTGTSIEVLDLFKNLPVRKKFLKSDIAESNAISKLMYSFAIGYPSLSFKYIKDGRLEFKTKANEPLNLRIANLLDENLKDNLIELNKSNEIYDISGFISNANYYRGSRSLQYIFVNNRLIDSNLITSTIEKEYRTFIPNGRFPAFFIFINTNPKNLDVNVHPNKRTIKFNYEDELVDLLESAVYEGLNDNISPDRIIIKEKNDHSLADFSDYSSLLDKYSSFNLVKEEQNSYEEDSFFNTSEELNYKSDLINHHGEKNIDFQPLEINMTEVDKSSSIELSYTYLTSIFGRYSVFSKSLDEIIVMDHRRADEAIKFNNLIKQLENDSITSQMLVDPIIVNLKADDRTKYEEKKDFIEKLGFDIDLFNENQVIIRSIPQVFENPEDDDFFYSVLDLDYNNKNDLFFNKLNRLIKSSSFRKGHRINKDEAESLMKSLLTLANPFKTHDGKSILLEVDRETLEKYFDR